MPAGSPWAIVGGVAGFVLWWLLNLLPFWDLSGYFWYFVGAGGLGLVLIIHLADEGKRALSGLLAGIAFIAVIFAISYGGSWAWDRGIIPDDIPYSVRENLPIYFFIGFPVLMFVVYIVWGMVKGNLEDRELQEKIAEGKERTRRRREGRRRIPGDDLREDAPANDAVTSPADADSGEQR